MNTSSVLTEFASAIVSSLQRMPKRLSSKYFYDDEGSRIFKKIMHLPEYYLTRCELEIFKKEKDHLLSFFNARQEGFELLELGAGDGLKTKILLKHFTEQHVPFTYVPIDISGEALRDLTVSLNTEIPNLSVQPVEDEYFTAIEKRIIGSQYTQRVVLFLGSNIGNFSDEESFRFLSQLKSRLQPGDYILMGFDLKKNPLTILAAYNDAQGVTREFNLNLLRRINTELGADFDLSGFEHYPMYDPASGEARSYLVSLRHQRVHLSKLDEWIDFNEGETVHTETSRKYSLPQMERLCKSVGLQPVQCFTDSRHYFADLLLKV